MLQRLVCPMNTVTRMLADPLALIDRNFQGFGKELFTDAGKYVIHFGDQPEEAAEQAANIVKAAHPDKPAPPVTAVAKYRNPDMHVIATSTADQLVNLNLPLRSLFNGSTFLTPSICVSVVSNRSFIHGSPGHCQSL